MSESVMRGLGLCAILLLSGCAATQTVPEDHFYRLSELPAARYSTPPIPGVLKVERVRAAGIFQERALLFSHTATPQLVERYHYHFWVDTPGVLIRRQLIDYLRRRGIAQLVVGDEPAGQGPMRLQLQLDDLERIVDADGSIRVRVSLETVVTRGSGGRPLMIRRYQRVARVAGRSIPASIRAMDQALGEIYRELARDLPKAVAAAG